MNWSERRCDSGQATVEVALVAPIVVMLCAVVLFVARTASDQVALVRAAGTVAREAALHPDDRERLVTLLDTAVHLRPLSLEISVREPLVTVAVRHEMRLGWLGGVTLRTLHASATMPLEPDG